MALGKYWRGLRHQIRVTIISTLSAAVVLGLVLVLTGFMLKQSAADTALHQTHLSVERRLTIDEDRTMEDIIISNHNAREREKEQRSGNFVPTFGGQRTPSQSASQGAKGDRDGGPGGGSNAARSSELVPSDAGKPIPRLDPADPANRRRVFSAMYAMDGTPLKDAIPMEMKTKENKVLEWPKSLGDMHLPSSFLTTVEADKKGRFKILSVTDVSDQFDQLKGFTWALLILWPLLVAMLGVASYIAVGSSFRPLHKLLGQAETLGLDDRMQTADQAEFGELAASINSYLDRIEKVVKQQEEFAVDAAHELCTPLTALRGQLELAIMQKSDPAAYSTAAKAAINQVARLERLVESLLLATRPRDGVVAPCDAQQALEEVQARWVDRYADKGVELQLSAEAFKASMPEEEIESVMENLLANALKFSPAATTVKITLDAEGHLIVQDQGPGIPVDDRERVFERFERGTTKARGFGIGLYLVRRLLEQRGGQIRIGDSPVGARVEVALP